MNILFKKTALKNALTLLAKMQGRSLPILSHVRMQTIACAGGNVVLTATDLVTTCSLPIEVEVSEPADCCLPTKALSAMARVMPGESLHLQSGSDYTAKVSAPESSIEYSMLTLPSAEFPMPKAAVKPVRLRFVRATFLSAIEKVAHAMSSEGSRYVLNGVRVQRSLTGPNSADVVATDGRRLTLRRFALADEDKGKEFGFIIPRDSLPGLRHWLKMCSDFSIDLASESEDGRHLQVWLTSEKVGSLYIKCIDGNYPDFGRVIPSGEPVARITLARKALLDAIRMVSIVTPPENSFAFTFSPSEIQIKGADIRSGMSASMTVPCECSVDLVPVEIRINFQFIAESLASIESEEIEIALSGGNTGHPIVIAPVGSRNSVNVVMPLRGKGQEFEAIKIRSKTA